jgi:uncharacterized protein
VTLRSDLEAAVAQQLARTERLPIVLARLHGNTFKLAVASDPTNRELGLSGGLPPGTDGMLFVFPARERAPFSTENTPVSLSIAFLNDTGVIVATSAMPAFDKSLHASPVPVRYALEVPLGALVAAGTRIGDRVRFTLPKGLTIR